MHTVDSPNNGPHGLQNNNSAHGLI